MSDTSETYWATVREHFFATAEPEPEPGLTAGDIDALSVDDFAGQREALGIRHQAGDFIGLSSNDDSGSGFPDYRTPVVEQVEFTEMDAWREERTAAGVPNLNDFGLPARNPRSNASPWQAV